jgi:hypothetical protein
MTYEPKLSHAIFVLLLGAALIISGTLWRNVAAFALLVAGATCWALVLLVCVLLVIGERRKYIDAVSMQVRELRQMDPEQWNALGLIHLPYLNIVWTGETSVIWEGVVPMEYFDHFMRTSNDAQISPERGWNSTEYPARIWTQIYGRLLQLGFIVPDSAAGNHSYRWQPGAVAELWARYLTPHLMELSPSPTAESALFDSRKAPATQIGGTERIMP